MPREPPLDDSCPDCGDICGNLDPGGCMEGSEEFDDRERDDDDDPGDICPPGYDGL